MPTRPLLPGGLSHQKLDVEVPPNGDPHGEWAAPNSSRTPRSPGMAGSREGPQRQFSRSRIQPIAPDTAQTRAPDSERVESRRLSSRRALPAHARGAPDDSMMEC